MGLSFGSNGQSRRQGAGRKGASKPARRPRARFSLLEQLENRQLLSTVVFNVTTNSDTTGNTLRAAILGADAATSNGTTKAIIDFQIPDTNPGDTTISLASPLPVIDGNITIDGTSQPGYAGSPLIAIDGSGVSLTDTQGNTIYTIGLDVQGSNVNISGLAIGGFTKADIYLQSGGQDSVTGNWIGLDNTGNVAPLGTPSNFGDGIIVNSSNDTIGGSSASDRNVISGAPVDGIAIDASGTLVQGNYIGTDPTGEQGTDANSNLYGNNNNGITVNDTGSAATIGNTVIVGNLISGNNNNGVEIDQDQATGNVIAGNYIGTDASGTTGFGATVDGVYLFDSSHVTIGGVTPPPSVSALAGDTVSMTAGNLISGVGTDGVNLDGGSSFNTIEGNYIGTDISGQNALMNNGNGITIDGSNNTIGGTGAGQANIIANNGGDGVAISAGTQNAIRDNSIYANTGLGIDLGDTFVVLNNDSQGHSGANLFQDFPVITSATVTGTTLTLAGSLTNQAANTTYTLDFFGNPAADPSGFGQGQVFLGSVTVTTNASGNGSFSNVHFANFDATTLTQISATATDPNGNTSEFAADKHVVVNANVATPTKTVITSSADPSVWGQPVTITATVTGSSGTPTGTVTFMDGSTSLGTVALNGSGTASVLLSNPALNGHSITAVYNGDTNNATSSGGLTQTVNQSQTATTLITSNSTPTFGQSVKFTATVSIADLGQGTPTGNVIFEDNGNQIGSLALSANGTAVFNYSGLAVNGHSITAVYVGDTDFIGSTSASVPETVSQIATTTTLGSTVNPSVYGESVTFTASVSGSGSPTGNVVFMDGSTVLGTVAINSSGIATLSVSSLSVSGHAITATYGGDTNHSGSGASLNETVNKDNTSTTLVSSTGSTSFGQSIAFTATVAIADLGSGTPTGNVLFMDGSTVLGTVALGSNGTAVFSDAALTVGGHSITAVYSGDTDFVSSASTPVSETVNQLTTSTSLSSSVNPSVFGESVTFTATVSGAGSPTGNVIFMDGNTVLGTVAINSSGVARLTVSSLSVSASGHAITASYGGDTNDAGSSASLTQTVNKDQTSTTLSSNAASVSFGQSIMFTATVSLADLGAGTPTGTVSFMDGSTLLGTASVSSNGTAIFSDSALAVGVHSITAVYSGDPDFAGSTSAPVSETVNQLATSTSLSSSVDPAVFGQSITFTAAVTGSGTPTGNVVFMDGTTVLGAATLSNGVATLTLSTLSVGDHPITASYVGDTNDAASGASLDQTVNQDNTSTTLISSASSVSFGQPITFTATVALADLGSGTPTGTVTFMDGNTFLASVVLGANGQAVFSTSTLPVGTHSITAVYSGDTNFAGSASTPVNETVSQLTTTTTLTSSVDPSVYGESVTFTATVSGAGNPTGSVIFMDGSTVLGTGTLDGNGVATLTLSNLTVSGHPITAIYGGDADNSGSNASLSQVVSKDQTATTLTESTSSTTFGQSVTFTATVSLADLGAGTPTGMVTFMDGTTVLGTASVATDGTAVLSTSSLLVGNHSITAVYSGDTDFASSASAPLSETVNSIQTTTTVNSSVNPSVSGQSVTLTATVTAQSGSGVPTGSVLFMDGTTVLGTATLDVNGVATLTLSGLSVGGHTITATYSGDSTDAGSSASLAQAVQKSMTSTTLVSSTASTTYGQAITFTASVSIADMGSGTPTGLVTFMDGNTVLGTGTISAQGVATLTVSNLAVGGHSITASYAGDANFTSSASGPVSENVNLIQTGTSLVSSLSSSVYGQSVTFTATVIAASGDVPTGLVVFMDGSTVLGTGTLDANGMATLTLSTLTVGSHPISATYGGSATDAGSNAAITQAVGDDNTSTTLSSSADPSVFGQAITLTATVTGSGQPTGNVVFMDGTTVLGTVAVGSNGTATLTLSGLSVGGHTITASYAGDVTHSGSGATLVQNVNRDKTNTTLVLSATSTNFGQSIVFTASVNIADLGSGTPTGIVTFYDGTTVVGTANLGAGGVASITCSTLSVGGHVITAQYSGDGNFAGSVSNAVDASINSLGTSTSLTSSTDPSNFGQSVLFTATVSGGSNETGTITFSDGSTVLGTVALNSNDVATLSLSSLAVGGHTITATYSGDADNAGSSASLTQTVNKNSTATTLTSSASSVTYGQPVKFTASVAITDAGSGTPTGNVVFMDGSTVLGTVAVNSSGVATLTVSNLTVAGHVITAAYAGDTNDTASSASLAQKVTQISTSTVVASSLDPSVYGQSVTFTATVTPASGSGVPTGSVLFMDGGTVLGSATLNSGGVATLTLTKLTAGTHAISATYGGDTNDAGSNGSLSQVVNKDNTGLTLNSSSNPSVYNQSVTLTATLANLSGGVVPGGSVVFMDGSTVLGTVAVNASGVATLSVSTLAVGSHAVSASFAGDANDNGSNAALTQVVNQVATSTTIASTANPSAFGQSITLTATVSGGLSPTGSVVFMDGSTVLGTVTLSAGKASLTISSLVVGGHSITASYGGDKNNAGSSASLTQTVNKDNTKTALSTSGGSINAGQTVTLTATVTLNDVGSATPTGSVTFMDGSTVLGTGTLGANGVATFTTGALAAGTHSFTAVYGGDSHCNTSSSGPSSVNAAAMASISGTVYNDVTGNGLSSDDTGLSGVTVQLYLDRDGGTSIDSADGAAIATVVTGANGTYNFGNLAKGTYFVQEVTPTGYVRTAPALSPFYQNAVNGNAVTGDDFDNYLTACTCGVTNVQYSVNGHSVSSLGSCTQGCTVSVTFTVPAGHAPETISLVSYTCPDNTFIASHASEQVEYNHQTITVGPGTYTVTVKVPPCDFQVDFVCGDVINTFGPANSNVFYSAQDRLISSDNGGTCAPPNNLSPLN